MTSDNGTSRTIGEVRDYLLRQLNSALRRPGMYGGESALRLFLDAVAFVDGCERLLADDLTELRARGAFVSTGVSGAVELVMGERDSHIMASVYAEIAHLRGWLTLDNTLSRADYDRLRNRMGSWCARDRSHSEVLAEAGPPSVLFGGPNPAFSKTFAYGTVHLDDPLVFFHLGSGTEPGTSVTGTPDEPESVLLATRYGGAKFIDRFVFTPQGAARCR
ncbi:hypothetical protein [Amycolatopsis sp. cg13]|uniref:hypothetical protein n=1 Tax=Amycolatopsis sp. cg13 TaxID=3238807 RepID=UPI003523846A